jgi:hypothetical protein
VQISVSAPLLVLRPDLGVAAPMAGIILTSSAQILGQAWTEYRYDRYKHLLAAE